MSRSRFSKFLIVTLALTAFLAGYLIIKGEFGGNPRNITGTILDKFDGQENVVGDQQGADNPTEPMLLVDRKVVSITNSRNSESVLYYEKNTGKVFEFDLANRKEGVVSDTTLPDFISSVWSPTKEKVISSYRLQSGSEFRHYDFGTKETTRLDPNIKSVAFSPDGGFIVHYYFDNEPIIPATTFDPVAELGETEEDGPPPILVGKIVVSEPNGQYPKKIIDTRLKDIEVGWPSRDQITLKTSLSDLFLLTEDGKLDKFLGAKALLEERWSKSGKKLLFSALGDAATEPMLWTKDVETREEKALGLTGDASKCAWSINDINIFCALSKSPSVDEIYQINFADGSRKLVAEPGFAVKEVLLSNLENFLLFVSAVDDKLYGSRLP